MGYTQSREYAELIWPIDVLITIIWVCYAIVFFGTLVKRKMQHIYVANWFFAAYIVTIAVLHIFNNLAIPVSLTESYPVFSGSVDAMVQWWYGHNAVGFFLTAAFLGMMYYYVPKQANRPIYSYRLSVVHFWALDLCLYVGRPAPFALHRLTGLGAICGYGVLSNTIGSIMGGNDQWHDDPIRGVA